MKGYGRIQGSGFTAAYTKPLREEIETLTAERDRYREALKEIKAMHLSLCICDQCRVAAQALEER